MTYHFWKRYSTKAKALAEARRLRRQGKRTKVVPLKGHEKHNFDVFVA